LSKGKLVGKPLTRITLSENICEQLVNWIASGALGPGDKLPSEHELMEMFSVGRNSVREALRALALLGLVETRQGFGACVATQLGTNFGAGITWRSLASIRSNLEIVETRQVVEIGVVQLVAARATPEDIEALEALLERQEAVVSDEMAFADLDVSFHTMLGEIAGNALMTRIIIDLRALLHQVIINDLTQSKEIGRRSLEQHRGIVETIKKGDPELARQAMTEHLAELTIRLMRSMARAELA
jgi:GntR family transcriptional repressor for pyruvate dehydrogenase complex